MTNSIKMSAELRSALCVGGFFSWYLSVMYICEKSLQLYGTTNLFTFTNVIFYSACLVTLLLILLIMSHYDFEGMLDHKNFRAVSGILMAESGAALIFTNADSFGAYSAIIGMCAAFGAVAVLTSLLGIKVSKRLTVVASGLAMGGVVRLIDELIYTYTDMTRGIYAVAVLSGIIALFTVRSRGFSREDMPIISYSEVSAKELIHEVPSAFVMLFIISSLYFVSQLRADYLGRMMFSPSMSAYEIFFFIPFIITAFVIAMFVKFHSISPVFALSICCASYAAILLYLPYFSQAEEIFYVIFTYAGQACFYAFIFIFIMTFSMDCRYPLFYTTMGFAICTASQLTANTFNYFFSSYGKTGIIFCLSILLFIGSPLIYIMLKKHGLTQESFEHRKLLRAAIKCTAVEMELSERERYLIELVVLYGYSAEQLPDKMMLSRNTVKAQGRNLVQKLGLNEISDLYNYFENMVSE